jgi:hypothetical protein
MVCTLLNEAVVTSLRSDSSPSIQGCRPDDAKQEVEAGTGRQGSCTARLDHLNQDLVQHEHLSSPTSNRSTDSILHILLRAKSPSITISQQIPPKLIILTTKIRIPIRNQKPRDQSAGHSES